MDPADNLAPSEGSTVQDAASQIVGLLDDDGQFNPNPDQISRAHPDYVEGDDERADSGARRDSKGRFQKAASEDDITDAIDNDDAEQFEASDEDDGQQAADTDDDAEKSDSLEAEADDADTDDIPIETLAQLAEALDTPVEDLAATLSHSFKAAGEDVTVTLAELESGYQKDADYRRSTAKLATDRRDFDVIVGNRMQQFDSHNAGLSQMMNVAEQIVSAEMGTPRMQEMRQEDPAEWAARRDEIGQRLGLLRQARDQAAAAYSNFTVGTKTEVRDRELAALAESGDWGENQRLTARKVMTDLGFTDMEVGQVVDSRMVRGALELNSLRTEVAALRAQVAKAEDTAKRVKKDVPRMQKPGKQVSQRSRTNKVDKRRATALRGRLKKSGRVEDAAAIIEGMNII